ncbi:MAG TPA: purine-nucleoside phosphorylase [Candidatus Limnocylindrales bacterium]|nr:purine-nucleoside phosphorylase [Candidatus Limnocylindrales bacterium]
METPHTVPFSDRLDALERAVRARTDKAPNVGAPQIGIVLGSGLGGLADSLTDVTAVPFADLPGWTAASAPGHAGRFLLGRLEGVSVACLQGRLHMYEGHSERLVVEPVLLMGRLGARQILLTNAAGGINADWPAGTLMLLTDHLNLTGRSPLMGPNDDALGERFPDLVDAYSPRLRALMCEAAADEGIELAEGVYAGLTGPTYETPAEVRMLRTLGADAVGMSTVLEAVVARWAGLEVCGVSLVTNPGAGVTGQSLSHEEVLEAAAEAGPRFTRLVRRFVKLAAEA